MIQDDSRSLRTARLLTLSAQELARRIRAQEVSSEEVVSVHIDQIRKVNPRLNAVVRERFESALQEAQEADSQLRSGAGQELPPLLGVPCTIKEAFALRGMPNTAGLVSRKGPVAAQDATAVRRLRSAGAIPLGVTNISELCMYMESDNLVYGRTNNPYDVTRTAGGSSGGEGAIVGAGASPFGLGSDIGGSIRLPAFFCGVFGHKPTGGMVSGWGQFPFASGAARRYLTTGVLTRRAEDLLPLLRLLAGPDGFDRGCLPFALPENLELELKGLRVIVVPDNGSVAVSDALAGAQERCAQALARQGAQVRRQRIPGLKRSFDIWSSMLSAAGGPSFASLMGEGIPVQSGRELGKWLLRRSEHTFPAIGLSILEKLPAHTRGRTERFVAEGRRLRSELSEALGPRGVLLYPPYPTVAPKHYWSMLPPFGWVYTAIFNTLEFPVTQVPLGLNRAGLPLGIQVVGIPGNDALTIAVARELEKVFGGWVPPREEPS